MQMEMTVVTATVVKEYSPDVVRKIGLKKTKNRAMMRMRDVVEAIADIETSKEMPIRIARSTVS
jgi:hypothetical protein